MVVEQIDIKKKIENYARKLYPEISRDKWTLNITEWTDETFQMVYYHTSEKIIYEIIYKHNEITLRTRLKKKLISHTKKFMREKIKKLNKHKTLLEKIKSYSMM